MTFEGAKVDAEAMLRQAGYTGAVEWLDTLASGAVRFFPNEHVEVYVNARMGSPTIEVTFEGKEYLPLEGPAHRAATVALLTEVLHPTDPSADIAPELPPIYSQPDLSHYQSETVERWLLDALDRSARNLRRVGALATELARRTAKKDRQ